MITSFDRPPEALPTSLPPRAAPAASSCTDGRCCYGDWAISVWPEQLHHSVANDLATILLLARRARSTSEEVTATKMEGPADPEYEPRALALDDDQLVTLIERTAEESLVKVRRLIAGLDRLTEPAADTASGRGSTSISSFHGGDDERRHAPAGFSIHSISRFRDSLATQVGVRPLRLPRSHWPP